MGKLNIRTPHAAVLIWNYNDRLSAQNTSFKALNEVEQQIISTVSCVSIQTSKSKGEVAGSFNLVLAPTKNWVGAITAGSWCAILMSNKPINQLKKADQQLVKMIGKIESVRVETSVDGDGTRQTRYLVTGTDWGHIFSNVLYVDNLIASENDPQLQGNSAAIALRRILFGNDNSPQSFKVKDLMNSLIGVFGENLKGYSPENGTTFTDINRLAKSSYDFIIPEQMLEYFDFIPPKKQKKSTAMTKLLNLQTGKLSKYDQYEDVIDSFGYLDPFSLQGANTFWQILLENSNPVLNEMFNEIRWINGKPSLTIYNRIKPFSYKKQPSKIANSSGRLLPDRALEKNLGNSLRSWFQNIRTHQLNSDTVISVNAGTNWRDKYNFVEIKPALPDFNIVANWTKQRSQASDPVAFNREGFRPLILSTKQFPQDFSKTDFSFSPEMFTAWIALLKEWFFDTHRLLNGTLTMTGSTDYIAVGDNIRFDAGLINPTPNINAATNNSKINRSILAHVETVSHSFSVDGNGARSYVTTIQFVRGIMVDDSNMLVGEGSLDKKVDSVPNKDRSNSVNVNATSAKDDPDPNKLKGT